MRAYYRAAFTQPLWRPPTPCPPPPPPKPTQKSNGNPPSPPPPPDASQPCPRVVASVHRPSAEHGTILFEAVGQGKQAIVMSLIKGGAGVNSVDPHGRMPLHVAVDRGHLAIAMALVLNGADVNAPDADQRTALHLACANGATSIARFLIVDARAAVNLWDLQGCTPLHKCAESGAVDIARLLASNEAEINALEVHTRTPLHVACEHMRPGVVQVPAAGRSPRLLVDSLRTGLCFVAGGYYTRGGGGGVRGQKKFVYLKLTSEFGPL